MRTFSMRLNICNYHDQNKTYYASMTIIAGGYEDGYGFNKGRCCCYSKDPLDQVESWGESVDRLLECKSGQTAFREFLKTEFSEENILFWLACEEYKKIKSTDEMVATANRIYAEFVEVESPKQINIDCGTRETITKNISQPNLESFDKAQRLIYGLMARDCYPRFLKSDIYQALLRRSQKR